MEDLITVLVPMYNSEKYLRETIDSIISQSYKNLEIFLVDDNSIDNTLKIALEYEKIDKRIKVITQRNLKVPMTTKKILKLIKGKYLVRCDHDDVMDCKRIEKQIKFLKENNYDLVGCYINSFGDSDRSKQTFLQNCQNVPIRSEKKLEDRFRLGQCITGTTFLMTIESIKELEPFTNEYYIAEDYYLCVMFYKHNKKIGLLEEKLVNYRVHSSNLSVSKETGNKTYFQVLEIKLKYMQKDLIENSGKILFLTDNFIKEFIEDIIYSDYTKSEKFKIISNENEISINNEKYDLIFLSRKFGNVFKSCIENGYIHLKNIFYI